jgi:hypothetical protein
MVSITTYFFQVIMLAAYTEAFLGISYPFMYDWFIPQKEILERIHTRICKHEGGIILVYNGR